MPRVALATCAALPALDDDSATLLTAFADIGVEAVPAVWDDPSVDWAGPDLVVVRSTWDYTLDRAGFLAWAGTVRRLLNPLPVLTWNTDKHYLRDLAAAGVPVVPTVLVEPGQPYVPPAGEVVVKPTVSAGARDTERHADARDAAPLVARLHAQGRTAMVQPYVGGIDTAGETSVLVFDGQVSHGARKAPLLGADGPLPDGLLADADLDIMTARAPSPSELATARQALAAVPHDGPLLYARVDLVPGPDGSPMLMELELTEPSLFLRWAPGSAERFARAVAARLR